MSRNIDWPDPVLNRAQFGGGGAWTPASPTAGGAALPHTWFNLLAGLYQDSGKTTPVTADNDPVGAEENQGSDSYDVVQATAGARPTYKTGILNSQPVLRLDGGDWLQGTFAGGDLAQPRTAFVVAQLSAGVVNDGNTYNLIEGIDASNRMNVFQRTTTTPDGWAIFAGTTLIGGDSDGNWNIWTILANGASSQFWLNGISEAGGDMGAHGLTGLTVGANRTGGGGWVGDIAERLIYTGNLSNADKNQVGQYLANKYNLSYTTI